MCTKDLTAVAGQQGNSILKEQPQTYANALRGKKAKTNSRGFVKAFGTSIIGTHVGPGFVSGINKAQKDSDTSAVTQDAPKNVTDASRRNQEAARKAAIARQRATQGAGGTIKTTPLGVNSKASVGKTSLLGR